MDSLDFLNQFEAFRHWPADVQQRVRARAAKNIVRTESGTTTVSRALNEGLSNILAGRPPAGIEDIAADLENVDRKAESIVSQWYETMAGRKFRALDFLYGADDTIRSIAEKAMRDFPAGIDAGPDELIAIATSKPGEYWKISSSETLHMVMELLSLDIHCDLDLFKNTDLDSCMKANTKFLDGLKKMDKGCTSRDGLPNPHQREYIPQHFATVPFARGNLIVLSRICMSCYGAWIYRNQIDTSRVGEIEPINDGFGSVGCGPIEKSEYLWDAKVVEQVARDWELRNGKPPSLMDLQKALQGVAFVGAGSEDAQKITDKRSKHRES
ncbi:hypothetical protein [Mycobacterium avium]|nr:hypothetical protein [Mycobacterium avium]MCA4732158.1 hypothetical protein [Mycobacterium avium subsp. hominissuis]